MMGKILPDSPYEEDKKKKESFKKKIVRTAIGVITLGVIGTGIYYGTKINKENNFKRVVSEDGKYDLENFISYDNLEDYSLVEVETIIGENKLFIGKPGYYVREVEIISCWDIFTGKDIIEGDYTKVVNTQPLADYLVAYDMIKAKYSKEDIETLLEKIEEDYEFTKDKTLTKE